jgi:zinc resistance-associated protein
MWKGIVVGTTALAIVGSSVVYAQQRIGRSEGTEHWRPSMEDMRAFGEARLAALRAGLALSAEQEKNWPAFEQAARDFGKLRLDRMDAMRGAQSSDDPVERMRSRAAEMTGTGTALQKLADATDPLYRSLDDNQKRRFAMLSRMGGMRMDGSRSRMDGPGYHFRGGRDDDDRAGEWRPRRMMEDRPAEFDRRQERRE